MTGIKQRIVTEGELAQKVVELIESGRFHYIKVALPGSKVHSERALPGDRLLLTAWRVKRGRRHGGQQKSG